MKDNDHTREGQQPGTSLPRKAAMYVRMATDRQCYSIENQTAAINRYAKQRKRRRKIKIVAHYTDGGKV
jgi:DNA invertase Pin-like site-specific DNA recombinase